MALDEKIALIKEVGEEIITEEELKRLLEDGRNLVAYDGFEPSGQMHIAQGILRTININKMVKVGVKFKMLVADWHAMANKKMGGDLAKIQTVGKYFIEVWKACGLNMENVEFVWASDIVKNPDYWKLVLQVGKSNALRRFIRTAEMMGRVESLDDLTGANIIYSCMQVADIFTLGSRITQLGMDQRKINVLAREIGPQLGFWKPVIVSHHMLRGLQQSLKKPERETATRGVGEYMRKKLDYDVAIKMSKSNPDSAIFMTDTFEDIQRKINKAYCPESETKDNPILEYFRYLIFEVFKSATIERDEKFGGNVILNSFQDLEKAYSKKEIHPQDLKNSAIKYLDEMLHPVRKHFEENEEAKQLLKKVQSFQVTR